MKTYRAVALFSLTGMALAAPAASALDVPALGSHRTPGSTPRVETPGVATPGLSTPSTRTESMQPLTLTVDGIQLPTRVSAGAGGQRVTTPGATPDTTASPEVPAIEVPSVDAPALEADAPDVEAVSLPASASVEESEESVDVQIAIDRP